MSRSIRSGSTDRVDAALRAVVPIHRHFDDPVAALAGDEQRLHVEAHAVEDLHPEDVLGGGGAEELEPALGVFKARHREPFDQAAEDPALDVAVGRLVEAPRPGRLARADGDVVAVQARAAGTWPARRSAWTGRHPQMNRYAPRAASMPVRTASPCRARLRAGRARADGRPRRPRPPPPSDPGCHSPRPGSRWGKAACRGRRAIGQAGRQTVLFVVGGKDQRQKDRHGEATRAGGRAVR